MPELMRDADALHGEAVRYLLLCERAWRSWSWSALRFAARQGLGQSPSKAPAPRQISSGADAARGGAAVRCVLQAARCDPSPSARSTLAVAA